jgi:hypothetical protein
MEQSPSWETDSRSASQEIPRLLWQLKVHYRVHRVIFWARWIQPTTTQTRPFRFISVLSSHLNLDPPMVFSLHVFRQTFCTNLVSVCCMSHPSQPPSVDHRNNIWWIHITKLLISVNNALTWNFTVRILRGLLVTHLNVHEPRRWDAAELFCFVCRLG